MNPKLFAYLSYEDAPAALRWLTDLGFTVVRRQDGEANQVIHSEVRLGDVVELRQLRARRRLVKTLCYLHIMFRSLEPEAGTPTGPVPAESH